MIQETEPRIERHKTAIRRNQLSRPVRMALRDGIVSREGTVFDYGCGLGEDVEYLKGLGITASGWDPVHFPMGVQLLADVVNLGYVINVIEHENERRQTLISAFQLARKALIVSAQVGYFDTSRAERFQDGFLSTRKTFQKYYEQDELRDFIRTSLKVEPYPAGTGVFYVFADQQIEADYCRRLLDDDLPTEIVGLGQPLAEETLKAIAELVYDLGRLPLVAEAPEHGPALAILAASENWMSRLGNLLDSQRWEQIRRERRTHLLSTIVASGFSVTGRKRMADLTPSERADVRSLFGSYSRALEEAERLLDETLRLERINEWLEQWGLGKVTREARYLHISLESELPEPVKLVVLCARAAAEQELTPEPTLVKFSTHELSISFAYYPGFDDSAHPALARVVKVDFETGSLTERTYRSEGSPPILHRKELFVGRDYPLRSTFLRLSKQEEAAGLLGRNDIGSRSAWERLLSESGYKLDGHRLVGNGLVSELETAGDPAQLWDEDDEADETERRLRAGIRRRRVVAPRRYYTESELSTLSETVTRLGRLPLFHECPVPKKRLETFVRSRRWRELLASRFDEDTYQQSRRSLWESLILELGTSLFLPSGRPNFKKWSDEMQWSIRSIFRTFAQATAESDTWLRKMGDGNFVEQELLGCGYGMHHEEKGYYIAAAHEPKLPLVVRLLIRTARLFATHAMPPSVDLIRISHHGDTIKFYEHEGFEQETDSTRLQTCKVLFRKRKVIATSYRDGTRKKVLTAEEKVLSRLTPR